MSQRAARGGGNTRVRCEKRGRVERRSHLNLRPSICPSPPACHPHLHPRADGPRLSRVTPAMRSATWSPAQARARTAPRARPTVILTLTRHPDSTRTLARTLTQLPKPGKGRHSAASKLQHSRTARRGHLKPQLSHKRHEDDERTKTRPPSSRGSFTQGGGSTGPADDGGCMGDASGHVGERQGQATVAPHASGAKPAAAPSVRIFL